MTTLSVTDQWKFILFFKNITPRMNPSSLNDPELAKAFWEERFTEALLLKKPSLTMQSYTELAVLWLAAYDEQQDKVDELIVENARVERERVEALRKMNVYKERNENARESIKSHFKYNLNGGDHELALRAVDRSLFGYGEP